MITLDACQISHHLHINTVDEEQLFTCEGRPKSGIQMSMLVKNVACKSFDFPAVYCDLIFILYAYMQHPNALPPHLYCIYFKGRLWMSC